MPGIVRPEHERLGGDGSRVAAVRTYAMASRAVATREEWQKATKALVDLSCAEWREMGKKSQKLAWTVIGSGCFLPPPGPPAEPPWTPHTDPSVGGGAVRVPADAAAAAAVSPRHAAR